MKTKSIYARTFDSKCPEWYEDQKYNVMYLKSVQMYFNDILKARGYVFLKDVYEHLGFPVTRSSLFVGWVHDLSNAFVDNRIDFGIEVFGSNVELDFNVDGDITSYFKD